VLFDYQYELLKVVASDDQRLAVVKIIVDEEKPLDHKKSLLSKDTVFGLKNVLPAQGEISLLFANNGLFFSHQTVGESIGIFAYLMTGEFPDYERVLPKNELDACSIEVQKDKLTQSLSRASLITDIVKINVDNNLEVSGESEKGKFKEIIPAFELDGKVNALFNVKYLLQPLTHLEDEKAVLGFNENNYEHNDFIEQIASRQFIISHPNLIEAFSILYFDNTSERPKRGAQSRQRAGNIRRFVKIIQQFELTYDIYSMSPEQIIDLMPEEFSGWKR